jgi:hypothetical protein
MKLLGATWLEKFLRKKLYNISMNSSIQYKRVIY